MCPKIQALQALATRMAVPLTSSIVVGATTGIFRSTPLSFLGISMHKRQWLLLGDVPSTACAASPPLRTSSPLAPGQLTPGYMMNMASSHATL
ncbi:hypothetical protein C8R44DRAFT_790572 [Mycena epipterygia]|nr:hypothetical protein C8R44DRAFT_790572 [Mycena epipterygia]